MPFACKANQFVKNLEWEIEDFDYFSHYYWEVEYAESVEVLPGMKLFLELRMIRPRQVSRSMPFFRFECQKRFENLQVDVTFKQPNSDIKISSGFSTPRPNFEFRRLWTFCPDDMVQNGAITVSVEVKFDPNLLVDKFAQDFKALHGDTKFSDFVYRVNDEDFPVHKAVLAARSSVFREIFTIERRMTLNKFPITDISKETFKEFLKFLYTDEIEIQSENACNLLAVADRYGVKELKDKCTAYLLKNFQKRDSLIMYKFAHKYNCDVSLKQASFDNLKRTFANQNLVLPDAFIDAPTKTNKAFHMIRDLKDFLKEENVQNGLVYKFTPTMTSTIVRAELIRSKNSKSLSCSIKKLLRPYSY